MDEQEKRDGERQWEYERSSREILQLMCTRNSREILQFMCTRNSREIFQFMCTTMAYTLLLRECKGIT